MLRSVYGLFLIALIAACARPKLPVFLQQANQQQYWVDSLYTSMTLTEKIGQLFMVAVYAKDEPSEIKAALHAIQQHAVGGLILMQGTTDLHASRVKQYQTAAKIPLLIGVDAEWGLAMRMAGSVRYSWNMTLGATQNKALVTAVAQRIGEQCRAVGAHMNFAPVVDINTNPDNPIIGNRSFGENKHRVAAHAQAFMQGLQRARILAVAKHFPGHGNTSQDSHKTLPVVTTPTDSLMNHELYPYKRLIKKGLAGVMTAHLRVNALDSTGLPASLSSAITDSLLQQALQFKGLVITDALNMQGASANVSTDSLGLAAFMAGNDILLMPKNIPTSIKAIQQLVVSDTLRMQQLEHSVKKILHAKYWAGLNRKNYAQAINAQQVVATRNDTLLQQQVAAQAITLIKNTPTVIPIQELVGEKIAYVPLGNGDYHPFLETLQSYAQVTLVLEKSAAALEPYTTIIIGHHVSDKNPWVKADFSIAEQQYIAQLPSDKKIILAHFATPYTLQSLATTSIHGILVGYQNSADMQRVAAQVIFGALSPKGRLPVSIHNNFPEGSGLHPEKIDRLGFALPESVGMSSDSLQRIDSLMHAVIAVKMTPGAQVLVARRGKVIYQKSFGFHTYDTMQPVTNTDVYDLASLTKILGALPWLIHLTEKGSIALDDRLDALFPFLKNTEKGGMVLRDVLAHKAQLYPWVAFYKKTLDSLTGLHKTALYHQLPDTLFTLQVADSLWLRSDYADSLFQQIAEVPQRQETGYKYSDLFFILLKKWINEHGTEGMDDWLHAYYQSIGATTLMYNPLQRLDKQQIIPTEKDTYFRHQLLHGYVHDMSAAMLGGVSGHSGLFGSALDVAKMMQLFLQQGYYGGKRYFSKKTWETYNHRYFEKEGVRRGLVLDKPQLDTSIKATCGCVSEQSFGHSGYTGTYAWADPKSELVYVFLSNRVYPTSANDALTEYDIRTRVQQLAQQAIIY